MPQILTFVLGVFTWVFSLVPCISKAYSGVASHTSYIRGITEYGGRPAH